MKVKDEKMSKKSKKSTVTIIMYIIALIVAIAGVTLLVNDIILFRNTVNQYVAQGYDYALVTSQLIPSQLLPGVCESVAVYGGIAFALLGIGAINEKTSKCIKLLTKVDDCNDTIEKSILLEESKLQDDIDNIENIETAEHNETVQEVMEETEEEAIEA